MERVFLYSLKAHNRNHLLIPPCMNRAGAEFYRAFIRNKS